MDLLLNVLIIGLVPVGVWAVRTYLPRLPKKLWPLAAIFLGMALQAAESALAGIAFNPAAGLALGAAGTGLRELIDQLTGGPERRRRKKEGLR